MDIREYFSTRLAPTVLTVAPLLTKWQMGHRGIYDLNKQAKAGCYALKSRPQSVFSSSTHIFLEDTLAWEESVSGRWPQLLVFGQKEVETHPMEVLFSSSTLTLKSVLFILLLTPVFSLLSVIHPFFITCYCCLSVIPFILLFAPATFLPLNPPALVYVTPPHPSHFQCLSLTLHAFLHVFWPCSHFPNWLSGGLIILQHPCCRLFYLSACRRSNPLISKYPSSTHTALQRLSWWTST